MLKNNIIVFSLILVVCFAEAQEAMTIHSIAGSITEHDLKKHLEIIAHDTLEGREAGLPGQKKAAKYLGSQFERIGLNPVNIDGKKTYFQTFQLFKKKWGEVSVTVNGVRYENMKDVLYIKTAPAILEENIDVIFAGYGNPEDYQQIDHENKGVVLLYPDNQSGREDKMTAALEAGAEDIFFIYGNTDEDIQKQIRLFKNFYRSSQMSLKVNPSESEGHVFYIPPGLAEEIFGTTIKDLRSAADKSHQGRSRAISRIPEGHLSYRVESLLDTVETENVLGFVEGTERPEEVVIVTAHYDHIGINEEEIFNGADDNGSGTTAVLEIAEAFSLARKNGLGPKSSVLFILFTGEEKGLLGSRYYVEDPVFPLDKTSADFNIDMIGRIDNRYVDDPDYVYLIGSDKISHELHEISEKANSDYVSLSLDYFYNADNDPNRFYYRSDHYNFAKKGVPVIMYFSGLHDDYHKPTDDIDKILFDRMERITKLVFYTVWKVANMERNLSRE